MSSRSDLLSVTMVRNDAVREWRLLSPPALSWTRHRSSRGKAGESGRFLQARASSLEPGEGQPKCRASPEAGRGRDSALLKGSATSKVEIALARDRLACQAQQE